MQLTNALLALSAVAAVTAHPSAQGHNHNHAKRATQWYHAKHGGSDSSSSSNTPAVDAQVKAESLPEAATTTTSAHQEPTSSSSPAATPSTASGGTGTAKSWPCSAASSKRDLDERATSAQIAYVGNIGSPYGCNWMEIAPADVGLYDYTMTFSAVGQDITCQCFNKIGHDGVGINGHWEDMLKFSVAKGSTKALAIQGDTQGSCACAAGSSVPKCPNVGYWLGTWVEVDMGSKANVFNGVRQSGADVSVLTPMDCAAQTGSAANYPGMKVSANGKFCSGITANSQYTYHAYVVGVNANANQDIHDADGVGCTGYGPNNLLVEVGDVKWDNMGRE